MKIKLTFLIATLSLLTSSAAMAIPNGPDGNPWKASADTPNASGHSGIVVTAPTYNQCTVQFQNAMDSHAAAHGDVFENIKYCHYHAFGQAGGIQVQYELAEDLAIRIADLEEEHDLAGFFAHRNRLLRRYRNMTQRAESPRARPMRLERADDD